MISFSEHRGSVAVSAMRKLSIALAYGVFTVAPTTARITAPKQPGTIPLVDLPAASARTTGTLGAVLGVRQAADGKVLVNDALRRQLLLFDSSLTTFRIVMDSAPGTSTSYGPIPTPLIPFVGDSSLFADWNSRTVVVLDAHGRVARALALPRPQDIVALTGASSGFDFKGRLIFQAGRVEILPSGRGDAEPTMQFADSLPILRADFDTRLVDTIGRIARPLMKLTTQKASDGSVTTIYTLDPLQAVDNWVVLSSGTVALIRGHDYHIDWIDAGSAMRSGAKLPFEWKHLTDDDKQRLSDSLRAAQDPLLANGYPAAEASLRGPMSCTPPDGGRGIPGGSGAGRGSRGGSESGGPPPPDNGKCFQRLRTTPPLVGAPMYQRPPMPPLADIFRASPVPDYAPPTGVSATMADLDDNVWILPRTSALSRRGELVYDVVNAKGELFERVRVPLGRAIAGFGKGGVVYLTSGNMKDGYYLERSRLPAGSGASSKK